MASDWLNHKALYIIKGVGKTPTDTRSAEPNPVVVNLMSGGAITLVEWTPNIPAVKGGGVWSDSPLSDGRVLLAAPYGNVTEKINIMISDSSYLTVMKQLSGLNQMIADNRTYSEGNSQTEPVYLAWWAGCGTRMQYALIFNMEIAPDYKAATQPTIAVSLTIEREAGWRPIPPGQNPKVWTRMRQGQAINTSNVNLVNTTALTDDLLNDTAVNRSEWNATWTANFSRNYVDIPASLIDGDMPALVSLQVKTPDGILNFYDLYVARNTRPTSLTDRNGANRLQQLTFNSADANATGILWTKTADVCGCVGNGSTVTQSIGRHAALPTGTYSPFVSWYRIGTVSIFDPTMDSGRFAVFFRCKQTNGAFGDLQARLRYFDMAQFGNVAPFVGDWSYLPMVAGAVVGCTNRFDMLYLGTVTIPLSGKLGGSGNGLGLNVSQLTASDLQASIQVDVRNNNVANRSLDFLDLVLMPIGEAFVQMFASASGSGTYFNLDNTGYASRGQPGTVARWLSLGAGGATPDVSDSAIEARGPELFLEPNVNNRLYFMQQRLDVAGVVTYSQPDSTNNDMKVSLNVVPRWSGIIDV